MSVSVYREYRLKMYLNGRHYILVNGKRGDSHPHTWEFTLTIRISRSSFTPFDAFEKRITAALAPYQNQLVNDIQPFTSIMPTVENMVDYFSEEFYRIIEEVGGELVQLEGSETPTRTYILKMTDRRESEQKEQAMFIELIDSVLDDILD